MHPHLRALAPALAVAAAAASLACAGATEPQPGLRAAAAAPGLTLAAERGTYVAGDTVRVRLVNGTAAAVGHNLCFAFLRLERWDPAAGWAPVRVSLAPAPGAACIAPLYMLSPGGEAGGAAFLPRDLPAATYRLSAGVEADGRDRAIATDAFTVQARSPD